MMEAREIMSKEVVAVAPDMLVAEAADLLLRYRIHGAPVIDEADQMVGMEVSWTSPRGAARR